MSTLGSVISGAVRGGRGSGGDSRAAALMAIVEMLRTGFQSWERIMQEQRTQKSEFRAERQFEEWERDQPIREERRRAELRERHRAKPINLARTAVRALDALPAVGPQDYIPFAERLFEVQTHIGEFAQEILNKKGLTPEQKWEEIRQGVDGIFSRDVVTMGLGAPLLMQALQATGIKDLAGIQSPKEMIDLLMKSEVSPDAIAGFAGFFNRDGTPNRKRLEAIFDLSGGKPGGMMGGFDQSDPRALVGRHTMGRLRERHGDDLHPMMSEAMLSLKGHVPTGPVDPSGPQPDISQDLAGWLLGKIPTGRGALIPGHPMGGMQFQRTWQTAGGEWVPSYDQARGTYTNEDIMRLLTEELMKTK